MLKPGEMLKNGRLILPQLVLRRQGAIPVKISAITFNISTVNISPNFETDSA